ncbi:hypothetical protein SAMN02745975_02456 [Geosporobacter subterraneus DSM 17957]|uniref:Uncharacterized protein n=1 Tax=Geosporobacter subterraneus DSM 17957 TaxID=1121919 RepID=A0A1M6KMS0_9FIRM|nr:hypothetical protein SAMN02745975_02456 [Geosporobacter subterraneus DSM 17957]
MAFEGVDLYISIEVYVGNGLCAVSLNVKFLNHRSIEENRSLMDGRVFITLNKINRNFI